MPKLFITNEYGDGIVLNILNLFNNINLASNAEKTAQMNPNNVETSGSVSTNSQNAIELLKNMLAGDILSGMVTELNDENVLLQLNNGEVLSARLAENSLITLGQSLTFMVESNESNTITLKPLMTDGQQALMITNALDAANYPSSEENIAIVKELLSLNMPVDVDTISEMVKNTMKFPDANVNTIANMMKLDIPVTQDNIIQFEAYKNYEHSITGELNNFNSDLNSTVSELMNGGKYEEGIQLLQNTIENLYTENDVNQNPSGIASADVNSIFSENEITDLSNKLRETFGDAANELAETVKNGTVSNRELLQGINDLIQQSVNSLENQNAAKAMQGNSQTENTDLNKLLKNIQQFTDSKEFGMLIKQMVSETMMLTPSEVAQQDSIKNFYKRLRNNINNISEAAQKTAPESSLAKSMGEIKSNIDFMNDLNKNMTFVQMPIKFSESAGNGDLYVFTNKKALKNSTDKVSALLHLDMDNLGPMDIYVNLAGKNVSTNFCLESEEMLDFVYANIDKLNARLSALGYTTKFEMKVSEKDNHTVDFVDGFINKENPPVKISQFVFDTKA